jgi:hypothetical protein
MNKMRPLVVILSGSSSNDYLSPQAKLQLYRTLYQVQQLIGQDARPKVLLPKDSANAAVYGAEAINWFRCPYAEINISIGVLGHDAAAIDAQIRKGLDHICETAMAPDEECGTIILVCKYAEIAHRLYGAYAHAVGIVPENEHRLPLESGYGYVYQPKLNRRTFVGGK